jgi:uncharacterized tellurite resistance protein B-like protein
MAVSDDVWARATFAGATEAQAQAIADLTAEARIALLEQLLEVALTSGALQRARDEKQRALDRLWAHG